MTLLAQGILVTHAQESWETPSVRATAPATHQPPRFRPKQVAVSMSDSDYIAWAIIAEAENEPFRGKALVGYSIKRRAQLGGFGGSSIRAVVLAKLPNGRSQYSGVHKRSFASARRSPKWREAKFAADEVLAGYYPGDYWANATYYLNPGPSDKTGWCWFKRNLVVVGWYGNHLFHREPQTTQDLKRITQDLPIECGGKAVYAQR